MRTSAVNAARDPWVWGPLLGAAAFQIEDFDRRTAHWAREHTPVFDSTNNAKDWSDDLRSASKYAHYATILVTPSGEELGDWLANKAKGAAVHAAAVSVTTAATRALKTATDRERPNGLGDESFPSGHTSASAVHTRLASRNLQSIQMPRVTRQALDVGLYALTIGTSWARIEAGWHYPSDTLAGMALGHFVASFVNDAFLGTSSHGAIITAAATDGGLAIEWRMRF